MKHFARLFVVFVVSILVLVGCEKQGDQQAMMHVPSLNTNSAVSSAPTSSSPARTLPYGAAAPMVQGSGGVSASALIENAPPAAGTASSPGAPVNTVPVSLSATEMQFFAQAGEVAIFEARVAQLAVDRASDSVIKSYASLLMSDQPAITAGLQQLAAQFGVPLPTFMSDSRQQTIDGLNRVSVESFDRQFIQVAGSRAQQNTIALFEQTAREAKNPAVRDFALTTLPILQAHLSAAQKLPIQG